MSTDTKELEREARKEKSFNEWLQNPLTKIVLTMIPPSENPDAVRTVLKAAFDAGYGSGAAEVVIDMLKMVTTKGGDKKGFLS